jgi:D-glycerate 3-kinase
VLGIKTGAVSYDDFYLSHSDQHKLSRENPKNKYLVGRGVAGTHDMDLGEQVIDELVNMHIS